MEKRIESVRLAVAEAARQSGRHPDAITLIGVSKLFPADRAMQAVRLGISDLGENRVQEMLEKQDVFAAAGLNPRWHLIGTLQRRKVRQIIGRTTLIHSVDTLRLAQEISERSRQMNTVTDVLLQVNSSLESNKHGFMPDDLLAAAETAAGLANIRLCGLMAMAQQTDRPDETLPVFEQTRMLFDRLEKHLSLPTWHVLSMGMTQDFRQAISCGATHVRIGSAIFGARPVSP